MRNEMDVQLSIRYITNSILAGERRILVPSCLGAIAVEVTMECNSYHFDPVTRACSWKEAGPASEWWKEEHSDIAQFYVRLKLTNRMSPVVIRYWALYAISKLLLVKFPAYSSYHVITEGQRMIETDAISMALINTQVVQGMSVQIPWATSEFIRTNSPRLLKESSFVHELALRYVETRWHAADNMIEQAHRSLNSSLGGELNERLLHLVARQYKRTDDQALSLTYVIAGINLVCARDAALKMYAEISRMLHGYEYLIEKDNESNE